MGLLLKVCRRIGGRKKKQKPKDRIKDCLRLVREGENGNDCFVSRDSLERRAVIKVNHVFLFLRNVWCRVL